MPVPNAAGNKPIAAINAVITTGLTARSTPCKMAVSEAHFIFQYFSRNTDIRITPF